MNLKIREAANTDYSEICNLVAEVYKLHLKNRPDVYLDIENPFPKDRFDSLLGSSDTKIFVIENKNNDLAAYSIIQIMTTQNPILIPKKFLYIDDFCVAAASKRNGIGKILFNHIVDFAHKENAESIQLNVWEFNEDAIKFYEALGMKTRNRRMEIDLNL
jgi:ribosomal protein S18 acetylase RimI-like enzyme